MTSKSKTFGRALGVGEGGFWSPPPKIGSVRMARIEHGADRGCTQCFPHGIETTNSHASKRQRSWKTHRKTKYRLRAA